VKLPPQEQVFSIHSGNIYPCGEKYWLTFRHIDPLRVDCFLLCNKTGTMANKTTAMEVIPQIGILKRPWVFKEGYSKGTEFVLEHG
jgi:hypothetical protein